MSAPAISIPSAALTRGLAAGTHIPGAAFLRDALGDAEAWIEQAAEEHATDPQLAEEQATLLAHLESVSRVGG